MSSQFSELLPLSVMLLRLDLVRLWFPARVTKLNSHLLVVIWSDLGLLGPVPSYDVRRWNRHSHLKDSEPTSCPCWLFWGETWLKPVMKMFCRSLDVMGRGFPFPHDPCWKGLPCSKPTVRSLNLFGFCLAAGSCWGLQARQDGAWCSALLQLFITPAQNLQHWSNIITDLSRDCVVRTLPFPALQMRSW